MKLLKVPSDSSFGKKLTLASRVSMEVSNYLVSWFITYLQDLQPTCIGVIIHLLSTMDIQVVISMSFHLLRTSLRARIGS